jgi:Sugar (and other) transporter
VGNWSWRVPCLLQAIPSAFQIVFIWFVPESPRWLISKNKQERALKVLAKVHAEGREDDELVQVEFNEIQQTIQLEQEYEKNAWSELWSTPGNRHRLIILVSIGLFSQWSGNALVSYYLGGVLETIGITDQKTKLEINGYLSIVQLVSAVGICFFVDKIGRRPLFITSCIGMLVSFVVETIGSARYAVNQDRAAGNAVIVFIFLYYIFYNLGFCGLLVSYSTEILPYRIRAKVSPAIRCCDGHDSCKFTLTRDRVSPLCSSSSTWPCGSTNTSTPLRSAPSAGSTTSSTPSGSSSSLPSSGSSSSRPRILLLRKSPSSSTARMP